MIAIPILDSAASFAAHVLEPAARSLAFACFAGLALAAFRVRSISARLAIWRTVLVVALAMPVLGLLLPPLPVFVPLAAKFALPARPRAEVLPFQQRGSATVNVNQVARSSSAKVGAFSPNPDSPNSAEPSTAPHFAEETPASAPISRPFPWLAGAAAIYFAIAIFLLNRLALGIVLGRRLERESQPIADLHALARLDFFSRAAGLRTQLRLAESGLLSVPVTFGVRRPAILLPGGWCDWELPELDAVLVHEISHIVRRDALAERLALLHRAIFWFSPLSWWLARRLADLAEEASDDAALASGADRTRYAETLLGFFAALEAAPGRVWWQGVSMATAGQAEKRVDRILDWKGSVAMRLKKPVLLASLLLAIPVVCIIAAFRPTLENNHSAASQQIAQQAAPQPVPQSAPPSPAQASSPQQTAPAPPAPSAPPVGAPELPSLRSVGPMPSLPSLPPVVSVDIVAPKVSVVPLTSMHTVIAPQISVAPVISTVVSVVPVPPVGGPVSPVVPVVTVHPLLPRVLQSTNINGTRIGDYNDETFAIVSGKNYVSVSSSSTSMGTDDASASAGSDSGSGFVKSLRQSFPGDFIWFIRGGKAYIIRDAASIRQAMDIFAPALALGREREELGKQQEALGAQQEALGAKQEALGEQMEKVRVKIPDLTSELQRLQEQLKQLGTDGTQEDLGRIQEKIGEIQSRIAEVQAKAGETQGELGEKQAALGKEQGKLGAQQGRLGERQGELGEQEAAASKKATRELKKLLDDAVSSGLAKPV